MEIYITTPIKAYVNGSSAEIIELGRQLSYTNTSIQFLIKKHHQKQWLKNKNPDLWQYQLENLMYQLNASLVENKDGKYIIKPGIIPYIDLKYNVINQIKYPEYKQLPWAKKLEFTPYSYQLNAVENLINEKHANVSIPTGCGKSLILLMLCQQMGLDVVVVTPSRSIFNELLTTFQYHLGKKYVGGYGDGKKDIKKKITIAIGKSLTMLKPDSEAYYFFQKKQILAVDESHTFAADQLEKICHGVLKDIPYRFFVSATQTRNDGTEKLLQSIIGKTVIEFSIKKAIEDKYLCPLNFKVLKTFSPSTANKKDPLECKRTHFLYNDNIAQLAAKIANAGAKIKNQSTLILVEELRQISILLKYLQVPFGYVHSGSKKEAEYWNLEKVKLQDEVDKFNKGEVKVLIGTRAIATGTNLYPTHNTINWVGGSSEIITKQGAMGRSTRKLEISKYADLHPPKKESVIYDFKVVEQPILDNQLKKRIKFYQETGGKIEYY